MSAEETEIYSGEDGEGNDDEMDEDQETSSDVISDDDEEGDEEEDPVYDPEMIDLSKFDPEYFEYECLNVEKVEWLLNVSIETVTNSLAIKPALAKLLLHTHQWNVTYIINEFQKDPNQLLILSRVKMQNSKDPVMTEHPETSLKFCSVCYVGMLPEKFNRLNCGHGFCEDCWSSHFEIKIKQGVSTGIACMALDCKVFATEDFVLNVLTKPHIRERYQGLAFQDYVGSHPELRFCPGLNCQVILRSKEPKAKRTECVQCKTVFCFKCGQEYHAPMDCSTMNKWRTKCADDSETANYLTANTKDCPKCLTCFEKNGGCNHMSCRLCLYEFCWICLEDWKRHSSNYECSKYKANPDTSDETAQTRAREALKKYLHYYERWDNHCKSLKLEEHTLQRIKIHIDENVTQGHGTWIDWEYLIQAASLLAKCRYTLQYTYPYAFYLEPGSRKELFEYQQANLEAEIEDLSWKIERAEQTDRANLENQMDIAEKRRIVLLKDFLEP